MRHNLQIHCNFEFKFIPIQCIKLPQQNFMKRNTHFVSSKKAWDEYYQIDISIHDKYIPIH